MVVPYGFGVGDFITLGTLAWKVYKSAKGAPESFQKIHIEVLSLKAVLDEAQETIFKRPLEPKREERLQIIVQGCHSTLTDLDELISKYESLGTHTKRTWDRMRWCKEGILELRARLGNHVTMLTAFISTCQVPVEEKLQTWLEDIHTGEREGSIVSDLTVDSLSHENRLLWRSIRKELEEIGINAETFEANHDFIFGWFNRNVATGAFVERSVENVDAGDRFDQNEPVTTGYSPLCTPEWPCQSEGYCGASVKYVTLDHPIDNHGSDSIDLPGIECRNQRLRWAESEHDLQALSRVLSTEQTQKAIKAGELNTAFYRACMSASSHVVLQYLVHGLDANTVYIEDEYCPCCPVVKLSRFWARRGWSVLMVAAKAGALEVVEVLIRYGAMVNYRMEEKTRFSSTRLYGSPRFVGTPLGFAISSRNLETVMVLLSAGAEINAVVGGRTALHQVCAASEQDTDICRALLDSGANANEFDHYGCTPLSLAIGGLHGQIVSLLLHRGANRKEARRTIATSDTLNDAIIYACQQRDSQHS